MRGRDVLTNSYQYGAGKAVEFTPDGRWVTKQEARNASPTGPLSTAASIKLSPTEIQIKKAYSENPFAAPIYWSNDADSRGWYAKPGAPYTRPL